MEFKCWFNKFHPTLHSRKSFDKFIWLGSIWDGPSKAARVSPSNPSQARHICVSSCDDVVIGWCNACNAWVGSGPGSWAWLEPEGQVVIPDWLAGADHTSGGCYIPWSPGHRLSSLSTTLPSGDTVLCHLDNTMYSLRPVTLDWSLLTAYFVDGKEMIQHIAASACSHQILFQDWKRYFGLWMKHQNRLSQVSSSCIFLISTDKFSPGGRGWGELGAEAHNWIINFKQSILRILSVIHPVKKSKIWINK